MYDANSSKYVSTYMYLGQINRKHLDLSDKSGYPVFYREIVADLSLRFVS